MTDYPINIYTSSVWSMGKEMSAAGSATYPSANLAILIPCRVPHPMIVKKVFAALGSTITGNMDLGLYTLDGTRLLSCGATALAGTVNLVQSVDVTDTLIGRGTYYLAIASDGTTATFLRQNNNSTAARLVGFATAASSYPLPATLTLATPSTGYMPVIGIAGDAVI